jgi:hypothetical protein
LTAEHKLAENSRDVIVDTHHLLGDHNNSLDGKLPVAVVEQILQAGAEQVDHKDVVEALLAEVVDVGDPGCRVSVGCVYSV